MTSPSEDGKRRYRKIRHKISKKKNIFSKYSKETSNNVNPPARITQKRLTNKSGFCWKGAVLTSPLLRGSRGVYAHKPKKGSTNFDLDCLLKAAKENRGRSLHHSASSGSSNNLDDPENLISLPSEEGKRCLNKEGRTYQFHSSKGDQEINSSNSSRDNLNVYDHDNELEDVITNSSTKKYINHCDPTYHESDCDDSYGTKTHHSSEKNAAKSRPPSLSSFQKFTVGIVEALVLEKSKQLPDLNWLSDLEVDFKNIYKTTRSKMHGQSMFLTSVTETDFLRRVPHEIQGQIEKCKAEDQKMRQVVKAVAAQPVEKQFNPRHSEDEKAFREKSIEAWVEAIPQNILPIDDERCQTTKPFMTVFDTMKRPTEKEFLRDFRKNSSTFKVTQSESLQTLNKPIWSTQGDNILEYSPHMSPFVKELLPINSNQATKDEPFSCVFFPRNIRKEANNFRECDAGSAHELNPKLIPLSQPVWSWIPWFQGSDKQHKKGNKDLASAGCPSPIWGYQCDSALSEQNRTSSEIPDQGDDGAPSFKYCGITSFTNKPAAWSKFPKISRINETKEKNFPFVPGKLPLHTDAHRDDFKMKPSFNNQCIKFSPRKMF